MKYILSILFILFLSQNIYSQSFEMFNGDTVNYIDKNNVKQGLWVYFNNSYKNNISQKGFFKDGLKNGDWYTYYKNGNLKCKTTVKNNRQNGDVIVYYSDGTVKEEGYWKQNRWIGEYKYYYSSGKIKYHWFYDSYGKRTGNQVYFYENGEKQIEGKWIQGKETGKITEFYNNGQIQKISNFSKGDLNGSVVEYYADGQLKTKSVFVNGQVDINQSYAYDPKKNSNNNNNSNNNINNNSNDNNNNPDYRTFTGNGYYKFVNDDGSVDREGTFVDGVLVNGKKYSYDSDGNKTKTVIIKNGRVAEVIDEKQVFDV